MATWSLASWAWQPGVLLGLGAIVGAYIIGLRRFRPDTLWQEHVVSRREIVFFALGITALVIALVSPLDPLSNMMFSAHMLQHMLLIYVAPPFLLLGMPAWLLRPILQIRYARTVLRFVTGFVPSTLLFNGILVVWHMPSMWDYALVDPQVHALEHLAFLAGGILVWWPIYGPLPEVPRLPYPAQMLYLLVQSLVPAIIGAFMTFSGIVIYPVYLETPKMWGLTPLADQQIAGLLMKFLGTLLLWGIVTVRFFQWFAHEEHEDERIVDDGRRP